MTAPGIVEFLTTRIAEDEEAAREADMYPGWTAQRVDVDWWVGTEEVGALYKFGYAGNGDSRAVAHHVARHDPARVLAECEAKRQIVAMHGQLCFGDESEAGDEVLGALALPYADHPDCPSWVKPDAPRWKIRSGFLVIHDGLTVLGTSEKRVWKVTDPQGESHGVQNGLAAALAYVRDQISPRPAYLWSLPRLPPAP